MPSEWDPRQEVPAPGGPTEPVCPRHPDRVAYVSCQRCHRPVCPECQRPAAVGVQCVDCVRDAARASRTGRTVFGGSVTDGRPLATYTLIGICVVVFLGQLASPTVTADLSFAPFLGRAQPWRFLTAAFVHSPTMYLHIAFNMYALWLMGQYLEPLLGRARYVATYLVSALGGSVGYLVLAPALTLAELQAGHRGAWVTGAVGASGAVFGLFGAFLVLNRRLGRSTAGIVSVIVINGVLGFVIPGIAWQAHLGGLLTGCAAAAVIAYTGGRRDHLAPARQKGSFAAHWLGLIVVVAVLVGLAVARYAVTTGYVA